MRMKRSVRRRAKKRNRLVPVKPAHDDVRLRLADTILKRLASADARSKPRLLGAYRLLVGDDRELLKIAHAEKRSGRPKEPSPATRFARWVWFARHYRIPFSAIQNAVERDPKWIVTRMNQTEVSISSGLFNPALALAEFDHLSPQERRKRILERLRVLARTGIE